MSMISPSIGPYASQTFAVQSPALRYPVSQPYGINQTGVQTYLPIQQRRALLPEEIATVQREQTKWWPKLYPGYLTPIPQMMADPVKKGILSGLLGGLFGAGYGAFDILLDTLLYNPFRVSGRNIFRSSMKIGLILGAIAMPIAGVLGYFHQKQKNESLLDVMSRLPVGATKRDMLADPAVQADLNRAAMRSAAHANTMNAIGDTWFTLSLLNSLSNSGRYRGSPSRRR